MLANQRRRLQPNSMEVRNDSVAQGDSQDILEEDRHHQGDKQGIGSPAGTEVPGNQHVAQEPEQEAGDHKAQHDQGGTH